MRCKSQASQGLLVRFVVVLIEIVSHIKFFNFMSCCSFNVIFFLEPRKGLFCRLMFDSHFAQHTKLKQKHIRAWHAFDQGTIPKSKHFWWRPWKSITIRLYSFVIDISDCTPLQYPRSYLSTYLCLWLSGGLFCYDSSSFQSSPVSRVVIHLK